MMDLCLDGETIDKDAHIIVYDSGAIEFKGNDSMGYPQLSLDQYEQLKKYLPLIDEFIKLNKVKE